LTQLKKPKPLHNQVYVLLKKGLIEGEFNPGERMVETRLAEKFGVSRGPIREALRLLERDSLVEQKNNHLYVVQFSEKEVIEIYQCRRVLDSLAAELACEHITEKEITMLRDAIEQTELAREQHDDEKVIHYNTVFHEGIVSAARNDVLMSLLESLRNRILLMRRLRNTMMTHYQGYEHFLKEHKEILEAIVDSRPVLARERMMNHIDSDIAAFKSFIVEQNQ
jgi:DNA-binding GntR family transcriptional regulator